MDTQRPPFGESRLQEILDAVVEHGDALESHYLENKLEVDISKALGKAKLAKFILGAGNRLPEIAERHIGGYALMVIGAAQGKAEGVKPGIEILHIQQAVEPYIGPQGPRFELQRIRLENERHVLFLTVEPPKQGDPLHLCRKNFQGHGKEEASYALVDGGIYIRNDGNTAMATSTQVEALLRRMDVTPSLDLTLGVEGLAYGMADSDTIRDRYLDMRADEYRKSMQKLNERLDPLEFSALRFQQRPDPRPEAVEARLARWRRTAVEGWPDAEEKLLGLLGGGLSFRICNNAESYLEQVTLIITFHGTRGVKWRDQDDTHQWDDVVEPVDKDVLAGVVQFDPDDYTLAGYPVQWENRDGNLVVTITLASLPPEPDWISENDDVVLIRDADNDGPIRVTWTATAVGHGTVFRGERMVDTGPTFGLAGDGQEKGQ